ncbi:unnamed protein product, partial [Meganyctiphanes norvegica]
VNNYGNIDPEIGHYLQSPTEISKTQSHGGLHYVNLNQVNDYDRTDASLTLDLPPLSPSRMALMQHASPTTPSITDDCLASPAVDSAGTAFTYETTMSSRWGSQRRKHNTNEGQRLCTLDLLSWIFQIARGMDYLSFRKVLHQDLAARNILLVNNSIVKISDFGLAREVYKNDQYLKKGKGPVPIKWIALEGILHGRFTSKSDVWSLGVVMWEILTL